MGIFVIFFPQPAFGHGVGGETLKPVTIGNRNATVFLTVEPPVFDASSDKRILVRFFDADTDQVIENVTYMIEVTKGDKSLFRYMFFDDLGFLILKIIPTDSDSITVSGLNEPILGGWMKNGTEPVTISGHIFKEGGLYKFKIEIVTVDSVKNVLDKRITYEAGISVAQKTNYLVKGSDEQDYNFGITSWYDTIDNFEYIPEQKNAKFLMPFLWTDENIGQTSVVHEEIHIPKTFADLLVTKYDVEVNGIKLPKSSVVIDDYSEDDRIVHIIISQEELRTISKTASQLSENKMRFSFTASPEVLLPLSGHTTSVEYMVDLWWDPLTITSQEKTKFFVDVKEMFQAVKVEKPITYDFILQKDGKEIFKKTVDSAVNAPPKSTSIEYSFSDEQVGPVKVIIDKINGKTFAEKDFMVVVEPKETEQQKFPIRVQSQLKNDDGTAAEGKFNVDITWFSNTLKIGEDSEFVITIYDKDSDLPIPQAPYDFVLVKDGKEIHRTSGFAKAGGSFENFKFTEKDLGPVNVRFENIANTKEFIEIPVVVTPEFPSGLLVVLIMMSSIVVVIRHVKYPSLNF